MFEASALLFLFVETPLHAGTGRGFGAVDLPIQRERTTEYPMVQASSIKGRLRATAEPLLPRPEHRAIFGPETSELVQNPYAGALSVGDARLALFPVRSLAGVFAWTTSIHALARLHRDATLAGPAPDWQPPSDPPAGAAWVHGDSLTAGESIVLEEFSFTPDHAQAKTVSTIGAWIAKHALSDGDEYAYWRDALPRKLCILPEDDFRDFVRYGTEVQTHVRLSPETKTVADKALWTSESLPVDTLLYAPLLATGSRVNGVNLKAGDVIERVVSLNLARVQLGGDETTGQGIVALRFTQMNGRSGDV